MIFPFLALSIFLLKFLLYSFRIVLFSALAPNFKFWSKFWTRKVLATKIMVKQRFLWPRGDILCGFVVCFVVCSWIFVPSLCKLCCVKASVRQIVAKSGNVLKASMCKSVCVQRLVCVCKSVCV